MGLHDHNIADDEFLDRNLAQFAIAAPHHSRARGQFGQSLDRALGPAHGIMFERVPQAEQEQEERAFGPGTQSAGTRSEEHTSELQSLMRISYAVFCLKKKKQHK